jgi:endonuclease/exonuclease/phosphatase family metal-dependent hydrolase
MISLALILSGYHFFFDFVAVNFNHKTTNYSGSKIKVMSYNVRLFDVYNWENHKENKKEIFNYIYRENPDIICIQEFYNNKKMYGFESVNKIINHTKAKYHYVANIKKGFAEFGIATFTKYEIVNKGEFRFRGKSNVSIFTDILINNDTVRVYNLHLESNRFGKEDYIFADNEDFDLNNKYINKLKDIFSKLKAAYKKRSEQVEIIARHIKQSPYPVIICGDFNDTPISYAYDKISHNLTDAFLNSGKGLGKTYTGIFPSFRIDYIFHSKNIHSSDFIIPGVKYSDHYPVICNLEINSSR